VHHAVNDCYVDKNYGGILIVWDRLFGSFEDERDDEPCVYGTRAPLRSWNPLWPTSRSTGHWRTMLADALVGRQVARLVQAPGLAAGRPGAALAEAGVRHRRMRRFDPSTGPATRAASLLLFVLLMAATIGLLWFAHLLAAGQLRWRRR